MKTTIEIADPLFKEANRLAAQEGTTVRALVEHGLREVLTERGGRSVYNTACENYGAPTGRFQHLTITNPLLA
ncbi:MAG: type II toxin-antitoxin system VapB family antitoxin [Pseudomonadota bacterium]|nr:type II toxin-antitoxin system VapB family antitoxin [Pseudomonadota bacterium]